MRTATHSDRALVATWRLLAIGFTSPTAETLAEVEALAGALADADPQSDLTTLVEVVRGLSVDTAAALYAWLFCGTCRVSPYEGSYEADPIRQGRQMSDVAAFYRAFGAETRGPIAERPDFVGCELEFLSFLELRRITALESGEEGLEVLDAIRESFLGDHAGRWLPTFFARVAEAAPDGSMYTELAALGARAVTAELDRRGLASASLPQPLSQSVLDADTLDCGIRPSMS
jgi:TorA maturation chaperone TorD